jgi:hypothetical protein
MDKEIAIKQLLEKKKKQEALYQLIEEDFSPEDAVEIKKLIAQYFWSKLSSEFSRLEEENGWTKETYEQWASEHFRTPYNRQ